MTPSIMIISVVFMLLGMLAQYKLKSKFTNYSKVPTTSGLSGKEIAEKMLRDSAIYDVQVVSVSGFLSDHYDPTKKTVNLSPDVYEGRTVSAAAVAAHECGHAVQHATAYSMLTLRSKLVPAVKISSTISQWIIMAGIGMMGFGGGNPTILLVGIILFAASTLFSIVTLPVEFDASKRALAWLDTASITTTDEHTKAKDALTWAAMTYVVAALASIAMLVQYVMMYLGRTSND
ncbi:MAG: zinc metallopeptidase [Ferruginibacter sp.]|nr:zinc metallopeptidase [Ferruginibacter sp.]